MSKREGPFIVTGRTEDAAAMAPFVQAYFNATVTDETLAEIYAAYKAALLLLINGVPAEAEPEPRPPSA